MPFALLPLIGCSTQVITFSIPPGNPDDAGNGDEPAPRRTDVGVLPVFGQGLHATCPGHAGAYSFIYMDDQDALEGSQCSDESMWVVPDVAKAPVRCSTTSKNTTLRFCRVSGEDFKNLAADVSDTSNHYAVLMLGDACPEGSTLVGRQIDNEDRANSNDADAGANGSILPNVTNVDHTKLYFCLFRGGPSTMTSFPDLGMDYAVFHDFDGDQPSWVLSKKWIHSDDEDSESNANAYFPTFAPALPHFMKIVEMPVGANGRPDTTFDLARVR